MLTKTRPVRNPEVAMKAEWFGGRLRELREARGLTRKELATRAGLRSEAGIRNLEQGVRAPSWPTVIALCQALGVTCEEFMKPPASAGEQPPADQAEG